MTYYSITLNARLAYSAPFSGDEVFATPDGAKQAATAFACHLMDTAIITFDDDGGGWSSRDVEWDAIIVEQEQETPSKQTRTRDPHLAISAIEGDKHYVTYARKNFPDEPAICADDVWEAHAEGHTFILEAKA